MAKKSDIIDTKKYYRPGWLICLLFAGISLLLALITTCYDGSTVYKKKVTLKTEDSLKKTKGKGKDYFISEPFELGGGLFSSNRLKVKGVNLPWHTYSSVEVQIKEAERKEGEKESKDAGESGEEYAAIEKAGGKVIFALPYEFWKEKGTWRDGVESGTWAEEDTDTEVDFVVPEEGKYILTMRHVETGQSGSRRPSRHGIVTFEVEVTSGVVPNKFFWIAFVIFIVGSVISSIVVVKSGKRVRKNKYSMRQIKEQIPIGPFPLRKVGCLHLIKLRCTEHIASAPVIRVLFRKVDQNGKILEEVFNYRHLSFGKRWKTSGESGTTGQYSKSERHFVLTEAGLFHVTIEINQPTKIRKLDVLIKEGIKTNTKMKFRKTGVA